MRQKIKILAIPRLILSHIRQKIMEWSLLFIIQVILTILVSWFERHVFALTTNRLWSDANDKGTKEVVVPSHESRKYRQ